MEVNIPENLEDLKRPALQKLCKRLGLKANGKNVDMIRSLQEYRSQASSSSDDVCTAEEPPVTAVSNLETPPPSPCEPPPKKGKKGKRRKRGSKQNTSQQQGQACSENTPPETLTAVSDNSQESVESAKPVADSPGMNVMVEEASVREPGEAATVTTYLSPPVTETDSIQNPRKRKRCDTYSISPPHKQARGSVNLSPPPGCQIASECTSQTVVAEKETEQTPISPPESTGLPATRKRRRDTFSISPSSSSRDCSSASNSTSQSVVAGEESKPASTSPPPVNRKRRDTFSISPPSSRYGPTAPTVGLSSKDDGKIQSEIMDLLQKRVEDRKADPNYRPVFGGTETSNTSRIPVKSVTANKFERAHKKQFMKMPSIVDIQKRKEKRAADVEERRTGMSAKKPKLHVAENVASSRSAIPKPRTVTKPPQGAAQFKPSVLSTKNMTFNFRLGADKQPKVSKTPGKPFVFSGGHPTSQKKKTYKRHSGKLPDFKFSLY